MLFAWLTWDPNPDAFSIPFWDHPVKWYGILFVVGILSAYWVHIALMTLRFRLDSTYQPQQILDVKKLQELCQKATGPFEKTLARLRGKVPEGASKEEAAEALNQVILNERLQEDFAEGCPLSVSGKKACSIVPTQRSRNRVILEEALGANCEGLRQVATRFTDVFLWVVVIAAVVGARLGHVFFYQWDDYKNRPWDIFKTWEGGLASHGGAIAILLCVPLVYAWMKNRFPKYGFWNLLDNLAISSALACFFIRLGNFMNQEILGQPSQVPWAIIFGHPADGSAAVPRHAVQLYEGVFYLLLFGLLWKVAHRCVTRIRPGFLSGCFFVLLFGFRFLIEFLKVPQTHLARPEASLLVGQLLSIPFILLGVGLMLLRRPKKQPTGGQDVGSDERL